jgi:GR25 family glycosyltransferase involved in LPS biosynthesis/GT2 family glycosyltransferase
MSLEERLFQKLHSMLSTENSDVADLCALVVEKCWDDTERMDIPSIVEFLVRHKKYAIATDLSGYWKPKDEVEGENRRDLMGRCVDGIHNRYAHYNSFNVGKMTGELLQNRRENRGNITVTMTTCKRFDLFCSTVNSFLQCCIDTDNIRDWIVVDDNSSESDILQMVEMYPFIRIVTKTPEERGHARSMNIIRENVNTDYIFHLEDDWTFFREFTLSSLTRVFNETGYENCGQVLLNRGYAERGQCRDIYTDKPVRVGAISVCKHIYTDNPPLGVKNCCYWPHYSLRVGVTRRSVFDKIGAFSETDSHFEREYANRYVDAGFFTVFTDGIYCYHSGKCTFETGDNAYSLNGMSQFGLPVKSVSDFKNPENEKPESEWNYTLSPAESQVSPEYKPGRKYHLSTLVLNLKRRPDRLQSFITANHTEVQSLQYRVFDAVDGTSLLPLPKHLKLFETGDFTYRRGIMGCALSHIKMWTELITSPATDTMLILEDDVVVCRDFVSKLTCVLNSLDENVDIVFLGHFLYPQYRKPDDFADESTVEVKTERWNRQKCIKHSMGGTIGYVITRKGAIKMLQHISQRGVYNAIDWVMFKNADELDIRYCYPHLVKSECVIGEQKVDSDIQYDKSALCPSDDARVLFELDYWCKQTSSTGVNFRGKVIDGIKRDDDSRVCYYEGCDIPYGEPGRVVVGIFDNTAQQRFYVSELDVNKYRCYTIRDMGVVVVDLRLVDDRHNREVVWSGMLNVDNPSD